MELRGFLWKILLVFFVGTVSCGVHHHDHPLSKINILETTVELHESVQIEAYPLLLGLEGENSDWVNVKYSFSNPTDHDWIGVFSPSNFSAMVCPSENSRQTPPLLCTAPIKFQYANFSNPTYTRSGKGTLRLQLINQRAGFSFALFTGGFSNPKLVAVSNTVIFENPKAPLHPRIAQGKLWNEMTVTWTSGYSFEEAEPFVAWGREGDTLLHSPAITLTYTRASMCGPPARTVGWRDPGFIHTGFLKDLWPNSVYKYRIGHRLSNGSVVWAPVYHFKTSPYPGQASLQRVIVFGDMGKGERDGSSEYNNFQYGSLNTTDQLIRDLDNYDIVFHIGDLSYANGYLSQWDQFTAQIEPIASIKPYMIGSGNHERDWPNTGSFYTNNDSGGECGVPTQTMFHVPSDNSAKFWYSTDFGMFRFCIADSEQDWRPGTEQYRFIENCLATVDRHKQPWLIFAAHRVLGYSSDYYYAREGSFEEPMGRAALQSLWQKYKVDIAFYGHVHNYERSCPIYENVCMSSERTNYTGPLNGTIHVVAGGGGCSLSTFTDVKAYWSLYKDYDYGFVKLTAYNHSYLLFEYKKSRDGNVYDSFTINRDYRDILACTYDSCWPTTMAS